MAQDMAPDAEVEAARHFSLYGVAHTPRKSLLYRDEIHPARVQMLRVVDHGVADLVDQHRLLDAGELADRRVLHREPDAAPLVATEGRRVRAADDARRIREQDGEPVQLAPAAAPVSERR